jgi:hypothetical protein
MREKKVVDMCMGVWKEKMNNDKLGSAIYRVYVFFLKCHVTASSDCSKETLSFLKPLLILFNTNLCFFLSTEFMKIFILVLHYIQLSYIYTFLKLFIDLVFSLS